MIDETKEGTNGRKGREEGRKKGAGERIFPVKGGGGRVWAAFFLRGRSFFPEEGGAGWALGGLFPKGAILFPVREGFGVGSGRPFSQKGDLQRSLFLKGRSFYRKRGLKNAKVEVF